MSIEFVPTIACNLKCTYCYQNPMRDAGNIGARWDWEAARMALDRENGEFTVFGGEPLLMPLDRLEQVFAYGFKKWGRTSIQTNAALVSPEHLRLFRDYNTHVGISFDGPGELSLSRWAGTHEATIDAALRTEETIYRLLKDGYSCSLIVTLWSGNTSRSEHFTRLIEWLRVLDLLGLRTARIHLLEVDSSEAVKMRVPTEILIERLRTLAAIQFKTLELDIFTEMRRLLEQSGIVSCVWNACDPLTTQAVRGVLANGTLANCGRTNKDGVNWTKGEREGHERQLALYNTPREHGGCQGCRFFLPCKGQCPGTGIDGDWRNRSEHCEVYYSLFEMLEQVVENPVSLRPERKQLELDYLTQLGSSGSHGDVAHGDAPHGDSHGDQPHGDLHGDSNRLQVPVGRQS